MLSGREMVSAMFSRSQVQPVGTTQVMLCTVEFNDVFEEDYRYMEEECILSLPYMHCLRVSPESETPKDYRD